MKRKEEEQEGHSLKRPLSFAEFMRQQSQPQSQLQEYSIPPAMIDIPISEYTSSIPIELQRQAQLQKIISQLQSIGASRPSVGRQLGFRFYDPLQRGEKSVAEHRRQQELPEEIRQRFLSEHAASNKKEIETSEGSIYYSPFVSLTRSLPSFINSSFGRQGDINIRHDVLHRAPTLGVFDIPQSFIEVPRIQNPDKDLPQQEGEILFDSSKGRGLSNFIHDVYPNPFKDRINVDLQKLLMSRGLYNNEELQSRVKQLEILKRQNPQKSLQERDELQQVIFKAQPRHAVSYPSSASPSVSYSSPLSASMVVAPSPSVESPISSQIAPLSNRRKFTESPDIAPFHNPYYNSSTNPYDPYNYTPESQEEFNRRMGLD